MSVPKGWPSSIQWGTMDVGVLTAPSFYPANTREDAEKESYNRGSESDPIFYRVPVRRTVLTAPDGTVYASAWRLYPTEEQVRLKPGWGESVGKERPL